MSGDTVAALIAAVGGPTAVIGVLKWLIKTEMSQHTATLRDVIRKQDDLAKDLETTAGKVDDITKLLMNRGAQT